MPERGFYKYDVARNLKKRIGWTSRDSLGAKKFHPSDGVLVVMEPELAEVRVIIDDDGRMMLMATHGLIAVVPVAGNVVKIEVRSRW